MTYIIEFQEVSKTFGRVVALRSASFRINKGISALMGPNGSGKSTVIKIILGLIKADSGCARVFGHDAWTEGEIVRSRIGVLHEKPEFPHWATGYQLVKMVAGLKGVKDPGKESETMLRKFGLASVMHRRIGTYSAGMVQRLGLAQAFAGSPELIILDEPTSNLDPDGRIEALELIRETHEQEGTSFLLSSHILPELQKVCKHLVIMNSGYVLEDGGLDELMSKYSLWSRKIRCADKERREQLFEMLEGASEIIADAESVTVRSPSEEWLKERVDRIVSTGIIRSSDIEETGAFLEELYQKILKNKMG